MKKYNNFINENKLPESEHISYEEADELLDKMKKDQIPIDWKDPDGRKKKVEWVKMMKDRFIYSFERRLTQSKKSDYNIFLPEDLYDYTHPISGERCSFVLTPDKITLANLNNKLEWIEIDTPKRLIDGNYIDFELDFPSGEVCLLGDNVRDTFPEDEWGDFKYGNDYYGIEADALKHINHFLDKGYFFVADNFNLSLSKNKNEYTLYREGWDEEDNELKLPNTIEDRIQIDSDHTLVIIDSKLLEEKLKKYPDIDTDDTYFKYCFKVEPGKYKMKFNWRYNKDDNDKVLKYMIMKKI